MNRTFTMNGSTKFSDESENEWLNLQGSSLSRNPASLISSFFAFIGDLVEPFIVKFCFICELLGNNKTTEKNAPN